MSPSDLSIPTEFCEPRCFLLEPIINESQAFTQAGEYKPKVFGFDIGRYLPFGKKDKMRVEARLLQRRLVSFWNVRCTSRFDYSRLNDYQITAHNPDAIMISVQGPQGQSVDLRVDQTGRSGGRVSLSGIERCVTTRDQTEWCDSYIQPQEGLTPQQAQQDQKRLQDYTVQNPMQIHDLEEFASSVSINGKPRFEDKVETIVVPPLETADAVVKRVMRKVMVSIDASVIHDWRLRVETVDLYFRPLFVFRFERLDETGNPLERKLEELDALNRNRWTTLATTEFQMSSIPWTKILKLSTDIGAILLEGVPLLGRTLQIGKILVDQGPGIVKDMRGEPS